MSQENVEVYFAAKERLAAGDHDGFARLLHPDITATVMGLPEPGPFLGRDAVLAQLEGLASSSTDSATPTSRSSRTVTIGSCSPIGGRSEGLGAGLMSMPASRSHSELKAAS